MSEHINIDPEVKRRINEEGWTKEDSGEGGARVSIGTKEEIRRLEHIENVADIASWIRLHPEVTLSQDDFQTEYARNLLKESKRTIWWYRGSNYSNDLRYISKNGDVITIALDPMKIATLRTYAAGTQSHINQSIINELEPHGFRFVQISAIKDLLQVIDLALENKKTRLSQESQHVQEQEFNF